MQTRTKLFGSLVAFLSVFGAFVIAATTSYAESTSPVLKLRYKFDDGSLPPTNKRDIDLQITGQTMTVKVTSYGNLIVNLKAKVPQKLIDQTGAALKTMKNDTKSKGNVCPGSKQNQLTASYGKATVKRTGASCTKTKSDTVEFERTELLIEPLLALLGDRDTAFKIGQNP
jgi:hypothetical protein